MAESLIVRKAGGEKINLVEINNKMLFVSSFNSGSLQGATTNTGTIDGNNFYRVYSGISIEHYNLANDTRISIQSLPSPYVQILRTMLAVNNGIFVAGETGRMHKFNNGVINNTGANLITSTFDQNIVSYTMCAGLHANVPVIYTAGVNFSTAANPGAIWVYRQSNAAYLNAWNTQNTSNNHFFNGYIFSIAYNNNSIFWGGENFADSLQKGVITKMNSSTGFHEAKSQNYASTIWNIFVNNGFVYADATVNFSGTLRRRVIKYHESNLALVAQSVNLPSTSNVKTDGFIKNGFIYIGNTPTKLFESNLAIAANNTSSGGSFHIYPFKDGIFATSLSSGALSMYLVDNLYTTNINNQSYVLFKE